MSSLRKVPFTLYPSTQQEALLCEHKRLHQQLYNAALEQKRDRSAHHRAPMTLSQQCKELTLLRREVPEFKALNAQSSQVTLKRLHLAFEGFFRRVKQGETPGYPRYKSWERFRGWGYKSHGDGLRVYSDGHHGVLDLSRIGNEQRLLSRKQRGSNGWKKQAQRVVAIHGKVARQRLDFLHQTENSRL